MSEPNAPNTLDSCTDGSTGSYHSDESVDNIRISAVGGGSIQPGATVEIVAKVWAYSPENDNIDFFFATDATNPQWQLIKTVKPPSSYANTVSTQYVLGQGSLQAVRVVIRFSGAAYPCPTGQYDDVDDLVFAVQNNATPKPSFPPTPLPTPLPTPSPSPKPTILLTPKPVSNDQVGLPTPRPTRRPRRAKAKRQNMMFARPT